MITLTRLPILRRPQGIYLRWWYNGWHYWQFFTGGLNYSTNGQPYRTYGTRSMTLSSGPLTETQAAALRTLANSGEAYMFVDDGWAYCRIDADSLRLFDNKFTGYEFSFTITIGSRLPSVTGFSPVEVVPEAPPYDPTVITVVTVIDGVFTIVVTGTAGESITIDWGDGSAPEVVVLTGSEQTITHDYTGSGGTEHTITIDGEENIITLDLSDNDITEINIPDGATSLEELILTGNLLTETPNIPPTVPLVVLDMDGNPMTICEIQIGSQVWACKNYDSVYPNSKAYDDAPATNDPLYGRLYDFNMVNNAGFCPTGWRVPTIADFRQLIEYLGGANVAGGVLKATGLTYWKTPNTGATDAKNFDARGGGYGYDNAGVMTYVGQKENAYYLTKDTGAAEIYAAALNLGYNYAEALEDNLPKTFFFSVRLIKRWAAPLIAADFFLPSVWELTEMYTVLHANGKGGFANADYWSSSEANATQARTVDFANAASWGASTKGTTARVRACRSFLGDAGAYAMGDVGPAGGLIFAYSGGKYYEAAPSDQSTAKAWSNVTDQAVGTTGIAIGAGKQNTLDIIAQAGSFSDYFLPSKDEFFQMRAELSDYSVGGLLNENYWTSSEYSSNTAWYLGGVAGTPTAYLKSDLRYIRAVRAFTSLTNYELRDVGPAGGLVFWKSGNDYLEAAPADTATTKAWSNITGTAVTGTGTAIGTGAANTTAIVGQVGHTNSGAQACLDYSIGYAHTDSAAKLCKDLVI